MCGAKTGLVREIYETAETEDLQNPFYYIHNTSTLYSQQQALYSKYLDIRCLMEHVVYT